MTSKTPAATSATPTITAPAPPDDLRETTAERIAERAAVILAQRDHQSHEPDAEARAEGAQIDEGAADEHERRRCAIRMAGTSGAAAPSPSSSHSETCEPTGPPSHPSQTTVARIRPATTSPSPQSSGW